jgi:hypothetical protein
MKKTPLTNMLLERLKRPAPTYLGEHMKNIYRHLFEIKSEEDDLEETLEYIRDIFKGKEKGVSKKDWYAIFHKHLRQGDFFNECFQKRKHDLLTEKERREYKTLRTKFTTAETKAELEKLKTEGKQDKELFNEEYKRYLDLFNRLRREEKDDSINGHMDMLLWNTMHVDTDEILYKALSSVFKEKTIRKKTAV